MSRRTEGTRADATRNHVINSLQQLLTGRNHGHASSRHSDAVESLDDRAIWAEEIHSNNLCYQCRIGDYNIGRPSAAGRKVRQQQSRGAKRVLYSEQPRTPGLETRVRQFPKVLLN